MQIEGAHLVVILASSFEKKNIFAFLTPSFEFHA